MEPVGEAEEEAAAVEPPRGLWDLGIPRGLDDLDMTVLSSVCGSQSRDCWPECERKQREIKRDRLCTVRVAE
jgi:hypothetical protein